MIPYNKVIFLSFIKKLWIYFRKYKTWDPTIHEWEIKRFEKREKENPPPKGAILFTGSSTIRYWKTLEENMAPLTVINRGFGGSRISDVIHYITRIVFPHQPSGIVFYAGENDLTGLLGMTPKTPQEVTDDFKRFCEIVLAEFPDIPIFFISIKPPKRRIKYRAEMEKVNELIEAYCNSAKNLSFIDIVPILSEEGKIKKGISKWDGIHLNKKGYELITSVIKPILLREFQ